MGKARIDPLRQRRVRFTPDWDGRFELSGALLGEPHRASSQVLLGAGDFDEPSHLQAAQVPRQCRLINAHALCQGAERIVRGGSDLGHHSKLSEAETAPFHMLVQELCDPPGGEAAVPAGAGGDGCPRITDECLFQGLRSLGHSCM